MTMLVVFLWPRADWNFSPEAFFAFSVAVVFWIFTEFKQSEEVIFRTSTPNDIRFGREIFSYSTWVFRDLLKDHNYVRGIPPRFLNEASLLVVETEFGTALFQNKQVQTKYLDFSKRLKEFVEYFGNHSSSEQYGSVNLQAIIPYSQFNEYDISETHQNEINETNRLASLAWGAFLPLISEIKVQIPEVLDERLESHWFRSEE